MTNCGVKLPRFLPKRHGSGAVCRFAQVQKAMGYSTISVTEGYTHLVNNELLELVERPENHPDLDMLKWVS